MNKFMIGSMALAAITAAGSVLAADAPPTSPPLVQSKLSVYRNSDLKESDFNFMILVDQGSRVEFLTCSGRPPQAESEIIQKATDPGCMTFEKWAFGSPFHSSLHYQKAADRFIYVVAQDLRFVSQTGDELMVTSGTILFQRTHPNTITATTLQLTYENAENEKATTNRFTFIKSIETTADFAPIQRVPVIHSNDQTPSP